MIEVNNKFEIGEECYTYAREKKLEFDCPVCKGTKKIMFNDYWISCKQCNKDGKIISDQTVVTPHKVRVRRIIASIWEDTVTVKYKVDCLDHEVNIRNCAEEGLYKTLEECEEKCREMNTGESKGVFYGGKMEIELIKLKMNDLVTYKYQQFEYCCEKFKEIKQSCLRMKILLTMRSCIWTKMVN